MSRQLAISACFSVFAMSAFALFQGDASAWHGSDMQTGTLTEISAPALQEQLPPLFDLNLY